MTHEEIWETIDLFAKSKGMSAFKLSVISGLDGTTFNKSKRPSSWPSTRTIAKILNATDSNLEEFVKIYSNVKKKSNASRKTAPSKR